MKRYWYILDINPTPWAIGPAGGKRSKDGKRFAAYIGRNQELYTYQQAIKELITQQNPVKLEGGVKLTIWFWRNLLPGDKVADGTNLYKGTEDALQGLLFDNDRVNVSGHFEVIAQDSEHAGKVIICIEPIEADHLAQALMPIPDEVFVEAWPNGQQLLVAATESSSLKVSGDGSEYETADEIF